MTRMYQDGTYLENNPGWHQEDSPWKAAQIDRLIKKNRLRPRTICEVGCGAGEILNQLADSYPASTEFFGYDISSQAYEMCRTKGRHNLHFECADVFEDTDAFFDIIMAIDVVEHIEDYYGFLRKLKQKGSHKILHIPMDISVQTVLRSRPIMKERKMVGHLHYFTKETALAALIDTGYSIIEYCYTASSLELPKRGFRSELLRIPRKIGFAMSPDVAVRVLGGYELLVLAK